MTSPVTFADRSPSLVQNFPRASYREIRLYAPERPDADVDLSDNTNQWGAPPSVTSALESIDLALVTQYPPQPLSGLQQRLADYIGVARENIVTGCGSDDLLDCIMRAFAEPGDVIVHAQPTFSMIPYFARTNGVVPVGIPMTPDWEVDAESMLATKARIVYLCAPNNPTGTMVSDSIIRRILDESDGIVVLDEAYAEFARSSWARAAAAESRLVVTRTLSKAFGLAGLRVGYAVGAPALLHEIEKARGPYKISAIADRIACTVLDRDREWVAARARDAIAARTDLEAALRARGFAPLPSQGNFVLVPVADAVRVASALAELRVLVRAFTSLPLAGDALRIGVGPEEMMVRALGALDEVSKERSNQKLETR